MKDVLTISRTSSADVRYAMPEDVHKMMDIGMMAARENGVGETDTMKLLQVVWRGVTHDRAIAGVIEGPTGQLEGVTLLLVEEQGHSRDPILVEQTVYVHPDFRSARGARAAKLVEFNKAVAVRMDLPLLIGILSNERTKAKIRLYERLFGEPSGEYWLFNSKTGRLTAAAE